MHELTLVQGIVDAVEQIASEKKGRVKEFRVGVGELAQFDVRIVRRLLDDVRRGTPLEGAKVEVVTERSKIACLSCGREWDYLELAGRLSPDEKEMVHYLPELLNSFTKCPACSKSFFEIEAGRSVRLVEVILDA